MAQSSWPRSVGTPQQRQFTDVQWGDLFGNASGVVQDYDGSAYKLTLATNSDTATIGSDTQDSVSVVGGFGHLIPRGQLEELTIPPASGGPQTTIIAVRNETTWTQEPGPCRLVTYPYPGTSDGRPPRSSLPEGVEVMPLYSVTRQPAQVLSAATVSSLKQWAGSAIYPISLPAEAPLGTVAFLGSQQTRVRQMGAQGPAWFDPTPPPPVTQRPGLMVTATQVAQTTPSVTRVATLSVDRTSHLQITVKCVIGTANTLLRVFTQIQLDGDTLPYSVCSTYANQERTHVMQGLKFSVPPGDHVVAVSASPNVTGLYQMTNVTGTYSYHNA